MRPRTHAILCSTAFVLAALSLQGCSEGGGGQATADAGAEETGRSYTVRGLVRQVPVPDNPAKTLLIYHEPIPDFVNSEGYETGMMPMTMPFPPAPGVSLEGIAPGDWVEFTFRVDWTAEPPFELTAIQPLSAPPQSPGSLPEPGEGSTPQQGPQQA